MSESLSIKVINGIKKYFITDDLGTSREAPASYVKYAIAQGDLPNCYINSAGEIIVEETTPIVKEYPFKIVGKLLDAHFNHTHYLLRNNNDGKTYKATKEQFKEYVRKEWVEGAMIREDGSLAVSLNIDEYQDTLVGDRLIPKKIQRDKIVANGYTKICTYRFDEILDEFKNIETKFVKSNDRGNTLGNGKYPDIMLMRDDGIVLTIDGIKTHAYFVNRQTVIDDDALFIELMFDFRRERIQIKIIDFDLIRLNSVVLAVAVFYVYTKLFNSFAVLNDILISGTDKTYWYAKVVEHVEKVEEEKSNIQRKTTADCMAISEMYKLEKSAVSARYTEDEAQSFVRGLKIKNCYIMIHCTNCNFISTHYVVNLIENELTIKFQQENSEFTVIEMVFAGKTVQKLTPSNLSIIAATAVASEYVIDSISIINSMTNQSYDIKFRLKTEQEQQLDLLDKLNN